MSLRPNCRGVNLIAMESDLGSKRLEVAERWKLGLEDVYSDERYRKLASQMIDWLVATPREMRELRTEIEHHAIIMNLLAKMHTVVQPSEDLFFETFVSRVAAPKSRVEWFAEYRSFFFVGRPLVGDILDSNWCYYCYLRNVEAADLLGKMQGDERIHCYYDAAQGLAWLENLVSRGADFWMFAS